MVNGALGGALLGMAFGLLMALLMTWIAGTIGSQEVTGMMMGSAGGPFRSYNEAAFLGMAFGAIIGAVLGGTSANKK